MRLYIINVILNYIPGNVVLDRTLPNSFSARSKFARALL